MNYKNGIPILTASFEASPTNAELTKAPNSDWAYDHNANQMAHNFLTKFTTGNYVTGIGHDGANGTAAAVTAGLQYGNPFWVPQTTTFDRIAMSFTVGVDTKGIRMGIYSDAGDGTNMPTALLLDAGAVAFSDTGAQVLTITINQQLTPGLWWLCFISEATPTCNIKTLRIPLLGLNSSLLPLAYVSATQAYGALPDPFSTTSKAFVQIISFFYVGLRVASTP